LKLDEHTYDLFTQVLEIYQDELPDLEQKVRLSKVKFNL